MNADPVTGARRRPEVRHHATVALPERRVVGGPVAAANGPKMTDRAFFFTSGVVSVESRLCL
jgi:hypothetical protein